MRAVFSSRDLEETSVMKINFKIYFLREMVLKQKNSWDKHVELVGVYYQSLNIELKKNACWVSEKAQNHNQSFQRIQSLREGY